MIRSKIFAVTAVVLFVIGIAMIDCAVAGEKVKAYATSITTKFHKLEVGDEEGHMVAVYESKAVWFNKITGVKSTALGTGIMDINPKTGQGTIKGYNVRSYPNGEKWFSKYEGKPVGKGHTKGTFTYIGGTGKYEGVKGSGTWESKSLAPGISYLEAEGVREYKGQ